MPQGTLLEQKDITNAEAGTLSGGHCKLSTLSVCAAVLSCNLPLAACSDPGVWLWQF
jgi:hypothetical protein